MSQESALSFDCTFAASLARILKIAFRDNIRQQFYLEPLFALLNDDCGKSATLGLVTLVVLVLQKWTESQMKLLRTKRFSLT